MSTRPTVRLARGHSHATPFEMQIKTINIERTSASKITATPSPAWSSPHVGSALRAGVECSPWSNLRGAARVFGALSVEQLAWRALRGVASVFVERPSYLSSC